MTQHTRNGLSDIMARHEQFIVRFIPILGVTAIVLDLIRRLI